MKTLPKIHIGNITVQWKNQGGGWCGTFDPDDEEDEKLLHLSILGQGEEEAIVGTPIPADAEEGVLQKGLESARQYIERNPDPQTWRKIRLRWDGSLRN